MPPTDDDHLLDELRHLLAKVDPVPAPVADNACTAFMPCDQGSRGSGVAPSRS